MVSIVATSLRIDEEDYTKLKIIAVRENRSLNSQMKFALKNFIITYENDNGIVTKQDTY